LSFFLPLVKASWERPHGAIALNAQNRRPARQIDTGSVSTHAISRFLTVPQVNVDPNRLRSG
jgi:hypothetical protein